MWHMRFCLKKNSQNRASMKDWIIAGLRSRTSVSPAYEADMVIYPFHSPTGAHTVAGG